MWKVSRYLGWDSPSSILKVFSSNACFSLENCKKKNKIEEFKFGESHPPKWFDK
jgi:hypothetical protein